MLKWNQGIFITGQQKLDEFMEWGKEKSKENRLLHALFIQKWSLMLLGMALLLGRAVILGKMTPFDIAFFSVIYFTKRDLLYPVGVLLILGSMLSPDFHVLNTGMEIGLFLLIQKAMEKYSHSDISIVPFIAALSTFMTVLFTDFLQNQITGYGLLMNGVEALLSFVLTLIFVQAVPIFTFKRKNYSLRNEEVICMIILFASAMTGTIGWSYHSVSLEHILSRYFILLFAFVGGASMGASVGLISGLILSLANMDAIYQMSLLAFSGLLAGLLKEGKKTAVSFGMILGSSILAVYIGNQEQVLNSTWETLAALLLFLITPQSVTKLMSRFIPGTQENLQSQYDYAKRVRDITANRIHQFSEIFHLLSNSFQPLVKEDEEVSKEDEAGHFMNAVSEKACSTCYRKKQCWDDKFYRTYTYMTDMMSAIDQNPLFPKRDIPGEWKHHCSRTELVLETMKQQYERYKHDQLWNKQIADSRMLVADQLNGVSQVMEDLAKEIKREGQELYLQEEQIRHALEDLGLSIHHIDIVSLDEGNVEIEMIHQYTEGFDECRKIIAPLLSDILGEHIAVKQEHFSSSADGTSTVLFGSAKEFEVETGVAGAARGGDLLSGDSFTMVELGNGKFAVAVSDGMGNGERARMESSAALSILQQLLQSGMDEKLAIKSVNSVLLLRSSDEMFATVDLALIDLYNANTTFMKIGSMPSFIKRGNEVIPVMASNLPIGILQDIEVELISLGLHPGDVLIMMTDGVYDAPGHAVNKELWMKRIIQDINAEEPQEFADCLLEMIIRHSQGVIEDDMTIVVSRVEKYQPEWAAFRWPGLTRIERPKTVS